MSKDTIKPKNIEDLIYQIKKGEAGPEIKMSQKQQDERNDGPARHTYPRRTVKPERLIEYEKLANPKLRPNKVKLSLPEGEDRFPAEAKVPNYKKYDDNGNYIKHKLPKRKDDKSVAGQSALSIARNMSLSNPMTKRGRKTVA